MTDPSADLIAKKFRKKPVVIEAMGPLDLDGDWAEVNSIREWCDGKWYRSEEAMGHPPHLFKIPTLEGDLMASSGDWIIRGVQGEFYPCKPDIFTATYEAVSDV